MKSEQPIFFSKNSSRLSCAMSHRRKQGNCSAGLSGEGAACRHLRLTCSLPLFERFRILLLRWNSGWPRCLLLTAIGLSLVRHCHARRAFYSNSLQPCLLLAARLLLLQVKVAVLLNNATLLAPPQVALMISGIAFSAVESKAIYALVGVRLQGPKRPLQAVQQGAICVGGRVCGCWSRKQVVCPQRTRASRVAATPFAGRRCVLGI
jgi:hypothetical protein